MKALTNFIKEEINPRQLQHIQNTMNKQPNARMTIGDAYKGVGEKLSVEEVIDYMKDVCCAGATNWFEKETFKQLYSKMPNTEYVIINGTSEDFKFLLSAHGNKAQAAFDAAEHGMVTNEKLCEKISKTIVKYIENGDDGEFFACDEAGQINLHSYKIQNYLVFDFSYANGIDEYFVCLA